MIDLFRDIQVVCYASCITMGFIFSFVTSPLDSFLSALLFFLAILIFVILIVIICTAWTNRRITRLNQMRENCSVAEYIAGYERIYARDFSKKKALRQFVTINLAAGYLSTDGGHEKALTILSPLKDSFDQKPFSRQNYLYFCNNMAVCFLRAGDTDAAADWLAEMRRSMESAQIHGKELELAEQVYRKNMMEIALEKGQFDNLEKDLTDAFSHAESRLDRTAFQWRLMRLYLLQNRIEEAHACYDFILENGGDCYYASDARRYMENIPSGENK